MERHLSEWLVEFGAPVLFAAQAFGILGVPIPDELLLTLAGTLVAKGLLHAPSVVTATIAGCLTGISLSYAIGRGLAFRPLQSIASRHPSAFNRATRWFHRFGVWLLVFGYFIPGVRHVTAITAGSTGMRYRRFAIFAYVGGVLWCSVFLLLGYYAGDRWREVVTLAKTRLALGAGGATAVAALVALTYARWRNRRKSALSP